MLVSSFRPYLLRIFVGLTALLLLATAPACKRAAIAKHEYMYVSAPETSLRDRVATMYNKVGTLHNGDRVDVERGQNALSEYAPMAASRAGLSSVAW